MVKIEQNKSICFGMGKQYKKCNRDQEKVGKKKCAVLFINRFYDHSLFISAPSKIVNVNRKGRVCIANGMFL
jgi:hypothetical protein